MAISDLKVGHWHLGAWREVHRWTQAEAVWGAPLDSALSEF